MKNAQMYNELKTAKSFNEILAVVNKYYDLDATLGVGGKAMITGSIDTILKSIGAKAKK